MIKSNQHILNRIQVLIDAAVIAVSYMFAWYLRFESGLFQVVEGVLPLQTYMSALVFVIPAYLILYYVCHIYTPRRSQSRRIEFVNIVRANLIGVMLFVAILYLMRQEHFSRQMILIFLCVNILAETMVRLAIRYVLYRLRRQGFNQKHILLVGCSRAAEQYLERIKRNPHWGYHVYGILSDSKGADEEYEGSRIIGGIQMLEQVIAENELDEVVITLGMREYEKLESIVEICEKSGIHTKFVLDYGNIIPTRPEIWDMQGIPVIHIRKVPLNRRLNRWVKRIIDVVGALTAMVLFSPVMIVVAVLIRMASDGPVIYKQERVGLQGRTFQMYKFRSMVVQDEESEKKKWTVKDDPRITPVGRFIRKTSIDELPQLFNVLKGEMSLVGPRPERPHFVEKFKQEIPRYMVKHQVRPGLTGWAQIHGYRGDTSIQKRIDCDLYYIENWTLGLDIKIIIFTLFKGFINNEY